MNCLIIEDEPIAQNILKKFLNKIDYLQLQGCFTNASEAFNHIQKEKIDLVFLDINMPGIDGVSFAKILPEYIQVIFTTAYREYAIDGFDLQASDYLLKPISFERFLKSVSRAKDIYEKSGQTTSTERSDFLFVRSDRKMEKIAFGDILYVESFSDYLKIHQLNRLSVVRDSLSNFEKKLPQKDFIRLHRSFLVNIHMIDSYTHEYVEVGGQTLTISRSFKEEVLNRLKEFE
jgi:DNA-binding LytR/AlgR family response regulator